MIEILVNIRLEYYLYAAAFGLLGTIISVVRWNVILKHDSQHVPHLRLIKLYYIGIFYNVLLPGSLTGDAVRAYKTSKEDGDSAKLLASVPVERISGLIALLFIGTISLPLVVSKIDTTVEIKLYLTIFALVGILATITSEQAQGKVIYLINQIPIANKSNINKIIYKLSDSINNIKNPILLVKTSVLSLLFVTSSIFVIYFLAKSVNTELPLLYLAAVIPAIQLLSQLPISIGGFGLREGLYVYFFGIIGVAPEEAVLIGLIGVTIRYAYATVGGLFMIFE